MKINKVYEVNIYELCEEVGIEPWDFPWFDESDEYFPDITLHCDNESYQWYINHADPDDPLIKTVELLRNNYGVYCDVIVGEF